MRNRTLITLILSVVLALLGFTIVEWRRDQRVAQASSELRANSERITTMEREVADVKARTDYLQEQCKKGQDIFDQIPESLQAQFQRPNCLIEEGSIDESL